MKTLVALALASAALFSQPAQARVTYFTVKAALQKVLDSQGLVNEERQYGNLSKLSVEQRAPRDRDVFQVFAFNVTYTRPTGRGERSCFGTIEVRVVRDSAAPAGVTASKMEEPVFTTEGCQG